MLAAVSSLLASGLLPALLSTTPLPPPGASADEPAVREDDLLVPALVQATGQLGARFASELALANPTASSVSAEALLLDGSDARTTLLVPASSAVSLSSADLFARLGRPEGGAAPLRLRVLSGDAGALKASARVFNALASGGTYGLSFPVAAAGASVLTPASGKATILGGLQASRLNVSLLAPFEPSEVSLEVTDAIGVTQRSETVRLSALQRIQRNDVLSGVEPPARVVLRVLSGRVQAYGTVVSNSSTNDPFRSPVLPRTGTTPEWTVPAVAAAPGRNGAVFASDLYLNELSEVRDFLLEIDVTYRPRDGGEPATRRITMVPGTLRVVPDVLRTLFPERVPGAGALELKVAFGFAVEAFAVTRSEPETGPSSQDLPCVPAGEELAGGQTAAFVGVTEDATARSNLVLVNRGPATTVTLSLLGPNGPRGREVAVTLSAGEVRQVDSFARLFDEDDLPTGALLVAPGPGGRLVASVARIDNRTNDPAGLSPVR